MVLQRGITGFWRLGDQPLPTTDVRLFRRYCYEIARHIGGRVRSVEEASGARNFAIGILATSASQVAVLLNAQYPIVALADPPSAGEMLLRFLDIPTMAETLRDVGAYEVMRAADLERRPTPEDFGGLSEAERAEIAYWNPQPLGDVIFNCWD